MAQASVQICAAVIGMLAYFLFCIGDCFAAALNVLLDRLDVDCRLVNYLLTIRELLFLRRSRLLGILEYFTLCQQALDMLLHLIERFKALLKIGFKQRDGASRRLTGKQFIEHAQARIAGFQIVTGIEKTRHVDGLVILLVKLDAETELTGNILLRHHFVFRFHFSFSR